MKDEIRATDRLYDPVEVLQVYPEEAYGTSGEMMLRVGKSAYGHIVHDLQEVASDESSPQ